jgi:hypothetical protein
MNHPAVQIVARLAGMDPGTVSPDATLGSLGLKSSLGLGILRSALERR